MTSKNIIAIASILFFSSAMKLDAATLMPSDITGLRSFDGGKNVLLLEFAAVNPFTEDRTVAHFNISRTSRLLPSATLNIPIDNFDPEIPNGIFELYSFAGDGLVSIDEWDSGTPFYTFTSVSGEIQTLSIDISMLLKTAVDKEDHYLSFSFRAGNANRYFLSEAVGLTDPSISLIPLPSTIYLMGSGLLALAGISRWRREINV